MITLEPKNVIARHGRSPDHADADALACRETSPGIGAATYGDPPGHTLRQLPPPRARRKAALKAQGFKRIMSGPLW